MSRQVTLELSDEVLRRAERLAGLSGRDLGNVLAEAVAAAIPPLDTAGGGSGPIEEAPDGEVLRLAAVRLLPEQENRLSELLEEQQARLLSARERSDLLGLMQIYEGSLLRQSEALAEAVRRGLREPLAP
jgi:hypothetical protein